MRGDAVLGDPVHLLRADLQLHPLLPGPDHRGVQGAVVVLFGCRDIVLEAAWHERPFGVDDAEREIAVLDRADEDAETEDVGELLEGHLLALLLVDRIGTLLAPLDHRIDAPLLQPLGEVALDLGDERAVPALEAFEAADDRLVVLGLHLWKERSSSSSRMSCMPMRPASGA